MCFVQWCMCNERPKELALWRECVYTCTYSLSTSVRRMQCLPAPVKERCPVCTRTVITFPFFREDISAVEPSS